MLTFHRQLFVALARGEHVQAVEDGPAEQQAAAQLLGLTLGHGAGWSGIQIVPALLVAAGRSQGGQKSRSTLPVPLKRLVRPSLTIASTKVFFPVVCSGLGICRGTVSKAGADPVGRKVRQARDI